MRTAQAGYFSDGVMMKVPTDWALFVIFFNLLPASFLFCFRFGRGRLTVVGEESRMIEHGHDLIMLEFAGAWDLRYEGARV